MGQSVRICKGIIRDRIKGQGPLSMAFLDVVKPFDCLSHDSILNAGRWVGLPPPMLQYLKNVHRGNFTRLVQDPQQNRVDVLRGVRQ